MRKAFIIIFAFNSYFINTSYAQKTISLNTASAAGYNLIGGTTSPIHGWFSKLTSRIRISPGVKGYFYNNVNASQMTISHELLHATHLFLHLPGFSMYTERAAYAYNLAYAKFYGMESLIPSARAMIGYYPKEYSWRFLSLFINMGIN